MAALFIAALLATSAAFADAQSLVKKKLVEHVLVYLYGFPSPCTLDTC